MNSRCWKEYIDQEVQHWKWLKTWARVELQNWFFDNLDIDPKANRRANMESQNEVNVTQERINYHISVVTKVCLQLRKSDVKSGEQSNSLKKHPDQKYHQSIHSLHWCCFTDWVPPVFILNNAVSCVSNYICIFWLNIYVYKFLTANC